MNELNNFGMHFHFVKCFETKCFFLLQMTTDESKRRKRSYVEEKTKPCPMCSKLFIIRVRLVENHLARLLNPKSHALFVINYCDLKHHVKKSSCK